MACGDWNVLQLIWPSRVGSVPTFAVGRVLVIPKQIPKLPEQGEKGRS